MQGEFKQCPNGHFYQGLNCPYCQSSTKTGFNKTEFLSDENPVVEKGENKTQILGEPKSNGFGFGAGFDSGFAQETKVDKPIEVESTSAQPKYKRTVFGDLDENATSMGDAIYNRTLVGWLVTYSHNKYGEDYKIYEGRNVIGRDQDCDILINDPHVSGKHALLLFRAGRYSLTDSQSTHGTFVNGVDIDLDPRYLNDGDTISIGDTVFKFRSSL